MALDLTGIENVEFYSGHYLDAVLEGDLKSVFKRWKEAKEEHGKRLPQELLAGLANKYFSARSQADSERDDAERWRAARDFHVYLLEALGYPYQPEAEPLDDKTVCPVLLSLRRDGNPFLWVVDAPFTAKEDDDPLDASPLPDQLPAAAADAPLPKASWRNILDEQIFRQDQPPRWVLFLAGSEAVLIERNKWPQGRKLRFLFGELFSRRQAAAMRALAGLLHRDVLAPDAGLCLHDTLDENSHKHAYAVSGDLKHGVRRSVELLANEAVHYRRNVQKLAVFSEEEIAEKLTAECLTWLYRLLFLFFVEARSTDLGVVPMASDAYRRGYSLESLRDLELVPLTSDHAQNGTFIHDSLRLLFRILNAGFPNLGDIDRELPFEHTYQHSMEIDALNSPLFDDERLEILKGVKFRNHVLQEVLQLLSLSAQKKRKARGRISYAQLGINQLGAVYEGLLSYTGFFATEDLYEVASEKDNKKLSGKPAAEREALKTYFVPASRIGDYRDGEIVRDENGKRVVHPKGTFIFRLAGRNREKSASYYTPEVLTKCLVKYALKELLWEEGEEGEKPRRKKTADEILALTICEPAMGSSAFLIEAVGQLADAYLEARQEERGETIPPEDYQREKRRVKARLATNNCYGVDLNPTAVELAKVSLWLATLYEGGKCPWFGLRLATGNSLVGARREVFKTTDVVRRGNKDNPNWLKLVPEPVPLYHGPNGPPIDEHWTPPPRPKGTIYHFLLPAEGMAAFDKDKVIKQLAPESVKRIKEWRKEFCKPFNKKDAERLEQVSDAVDRLFAQVVRERVLATQETSDRISVWGEAPSAQKAILLVRDQEELATSLEDGSSAYRRLKLAMDAWCALWFWPLEKAGLLPDRATWLAQMEMVLKGQLTHEEVWQQPRLFADVTAPEEGEEVRSEITLGHVSRAQDASANRLKQLRELSDAFRTQRADYFEECGLADIEAVLEQETTLRTAEEIAAHLRFHHWALRFAEVLAKRGGFDLILGNPPWVKLEWKEGAVLGEFDALLELRGLSAADQALRRPALLENDNARMAYFDHYAEMQGAQAFYGDPGNYPPLRSIQTNLYKCFLVRAWSMGSNAGVTALLHPDGIYDDAKGGSLRRSVYPRVRVHYQFVNEGRLFPEIQNQRRFSINVFSAAPQGQPAFVSVSNLLHPRTVDECWEHDGLGRVPGIKNSEGDFSTPGHRNRIIQVDEERLALFRSVYESPDVPIREARLPVIHAVEIVKVLERFVSQPQRLSHIKSRYSSTVLFDESQAQRDGLLVRHTSRPARLGDWVVQGAHIYVGTPFYRTPNEVCDSNRAYTDIDLLEIDEGFLPRTNFAPQSAAWRQVPEWRGERVVDFFRIAMRKMLDPAASRTLAAAVIPKGVIHISSCFSLAMNSVDLVFISALFKSIPFDFFIKTTGKSNLQSNLVEALPVPDASEEFSRELCVRTLILDCLSLPYSELWEDAVRQAGQLSFEPASYHRCLRGRLDVPASWEPQAVARAPLERRQALLEIDVLVSMLLGLTTDELIAIWDIQFPVLRQYEKAWMYDQFGRVVPTSKTAAGNPAVSLVELAATLKQQAGFDVHAEYHPDGSNTQELRKQKIRLGKKEAAVLGVPERCTMADILAETEVRWSDEDHPEGRPVPLVGLRYTDPGLEPHMERVYPTPWTRCDREADYRQAWAEFERRLGKKMPEGTPL